jgi:ABC-type lipoprotein export system ATPase subunit
MSETLIVCENLVKIYSLAGIEVVALQGLDLTVGRGEMLGIVGASGSGKSTLLNVLGGLDRPSAGRVRVGEQELLKLSDAQLNAYRRQKVGFIWQQTTRNLIPYLTAIENVELPMRLTRVRRKERRRRAQELLEALGMAHRMKHSPVRLSGGEQQRAAIAVALANQPLILLADEPTGEVDTATAQEVYAALRSMNTQYGMTTLIVSHDPNLSRHTDRVVAIRDGKTSTETVRAMRSQESEAPSQNGARPTEKTIEPPQAHHFEELIVLDSAGRMQIPRDYLEALDIGNRVRLELEDDRISIFPVAGRGQPASSSSPTPINPDELYIEADQAPQASQKTLSARLKRAAQRLRSGQKVDAKAASVQEVNLESPNKDADKRR